MLFDTPPLAEQERDVVARIDELRHVVREPPRWTGVLRRNLLARAVRGSNSIEGYNVSLDDALAAAEGEEPLEADKEAWAAVAGYQQAMTYVLQLADDPHCVLGLALIRSLHFMMLQHDLSKSPGRWRSGPAYVRNDATGEIVYEGPDADLVPGLMAELVEDAGSVDGTLPAMIRAGMAHLNLVMVHPFRDGNGRMGRALQTLVLAREGILAPELSSIEEYLGRNTGDYYDVLGLVGGGTWQPERDARPWIGFTLTAHYRQAHTVLRRVKETERAWEMLSELVARLGLPERTIVALYDASVGLRVRNAIYRSEAELSEHAAGRDLRLLVDRGLLVPHGEKRGRFYRGSEVLKDIHHRSRQQVPPIGDPFEAA